MSRNTVDNFFNEIKVLGPHVLSEDEMDFIGLPRRFRSVRPDMIAPGTMRAKTLAYLARLDEMIQAGLGILYVGTNGVGKTCSAVSIMLEAQRRDFTTFFFEASKLKGAVINSDTAQGGKKVWKILHDVDLLVLDDIGKGSADAKGFGESLLDELLRSRSANMLSTLMTTNVTNIGTIFNTSTLSSMQETTFTVPCVGPDWRGETKISLNLDT